MISTFSLIIRLLVSACSGALIGYERGKYGRAAGLRTHMLISVGTAMTSVTGIYMTSAGLGDPTRIPAGVISGIGFVCAGIILLKGSSKVTGLTTAASMWATSTVGIAYGAGYYAAGAAATVLIYLILTVLTRFEVNQKKDHLYFIEILDSSEMNSVYKKITEMYPELHSIDIHPPKSGISGHIGLSFNVREGTGNKLGNIEENILSIPGVVYIIRE